MEFSQAENEQLPMLIREKRNTASRDEVPCLFSSSLVKTALFIVMTPAGQPMDSESSELESKEPRKLPEEEPGNH